MISRVPPSALPDLHPALQLACPARPLARLRLRLAARAAARGRRAAPHPHPAPAGLGRPRGAGRADPAPASRAATTPADHPRHCAAVAPPPGRPEVDLPAPDRTAAGQRRDHRADRAARHRKRLVGVPADPGRAAQVRSPGQRILRSAGSSRRCGSPRLRSDAPIRPGGSSCTRKPRRCLPRTSFTWTAQ